MIGTNSREVSNNVQGAQTLRVTVFPYTCPFIMEIIRVASILELWILNFKSIKISLPLD